MQKQLRRKRWNRQAALWAIYVETDPNRMNLLEQILERISAGAPSPASILDLGCGEGVFCRMMQSRFPSARIAGVDFSDGLVEIARKRSSNIDYVIGDFEAPEGMPLDRRFDLAIALFSFMEAESLELAFENARAMLADNGRLVVVVTDPYIDDYKYRAGKREGKHSDTSLTWSRHSEVTLTGSFATTEGMPSGKYHRILRPMLTYIQTASNCALRLIGGAEVIGTITPHSDGGTAVFVLTFEACAN